MGAEFNSVKLKGTQDEVRKQFEDIQEQDRYDNGHSYSGGFGMARGLDFERLYLIHTEEEAEKWLQENCQKWEPAVALRLDKDQWMIGAWCSS